MKMLIEKNTLMEGINAVSKALSTRNIVPVLNGIKFDLQTEGLYLTATDNDITIRSFIPKLDDDMTILEEGSIIIQGRYNENLQHYVKRKRGFEDFVQG